jgi:ectoine hydroxylase-related dioxygenase (phytanoyl-CoA dioxygenase family)
MTPTFSLDAEQIAFFREQGYLRLESISTSDEVEWLRGIFDRLFAERAGWERGQSFDLAGSDEAGKAPVLPQIINPVEFAPELAKTQFRANALGIARQFFGPEAEPWFEHAICKPAGIGAPTPWHQDEAHRYDPGVDYEQLSIWMPLQPATMANGCVQYIPGSHRGPVLEHRSLDGDARKSALECIGAFDRELAVPCILPPGGAAIHHCRTLHAAGANTTQEPRRAYILAFRGAPRPAPARAMHPWLAGKHTPASERAEAWQRRGGPVGRGARKMAEAARELSGRVGRRLRRMFGQ